jgi:cytoskeletal protein CcmA (bactofilin family)
MKISKHFLAKSTVNDSFSVSKGLVIHGNIEGSVCGRIEGHVYGNIELEGKVIIADDAFVSGYIVGTDININGTVKGNIICKGKLTVGEKADISGDILSVAISIDQNCKIKGTIRKTDSITEEDVNSVKINTLPKINASLKAIVPDESQANKATGEAWW